MHQYRSIGFSNRACFASLLVAVISMAPRVHAIPPGVEKWVRVQTQNFTVLSNASPKAVRNCVREVERLGFILDGGQEVHGARALVPTTIVLFKDEASFAPYKMGTDGRPMNFVGLFTPGQDANFMGLSLEAGRASVQTAYHEYVHYFLSKRALEVPLWVNEGMAEFYSTFRMEENQFEIGRPVEDHVHLLQVVAMMPFTDLFEITPLSRDYNEGLRQGIFYAESWALYHYILHGRPELAPRLATFLEKLSTGAETHAAFVAAFGTDYEPLEQELRAYVATGAFEVKRMELRVQETEADVKVEPASRVEVLYTLAEFLAHTTPWEQREIETHLQEAIAAEPLHARSHAAMARLLEARDKRVDADLEFQTAIRLAPDDQRVCFQLGVHELHRAMPDFNPLDPPKELPPRARRARAHFQHVNELNADFVESRIMLGITYLMDPGPTGPGIAALREALSMEPVRMDAALWLVILLVRNNDPEAAALLAEQVEAHSRDPKLRAVAQEVLHTDAVDRFRRKSAASAADRERTRVAREEMSRTAAVEEVQQELDEAETRKFQSDRYNDAVRRVKAGEVPEAIGILEPLADRAKDPELATKARELLAQLRDYQQRQQEEKLFDQAIATAKKGDLKAAIASLERLRIQTRDSKFRTRVENTLVQLRALAR